MKNKFWKKFPEKGFFKFISANFFPEKTLNIITETYLILTQNHNKIDTDLFDLYFFDTIFIYGYEKNFMNAQSKTKDLS